MSTADASRIRKGVTATPSIEKLRPDPDGLDFAGLRQAGIDLLQELCGSVWTDYNLHDPGVTLLEQLCYALTDLVYRSRFEAEEYLFGTDGRLDGVSHSLLPPEEALSCAPLTPLDYRKVFTDALPEIRNMWVVPALEGALPGIVNIHLQLADELEDDSEGSAALIAEAAKLYHRHRNLCEDLGEITIVGHLDYILSGTIEIVDGKPPGEILANIYSACTSVVSPPIPQKPYIDLAEDELDRLFDGPFTPHGYVDGTTLSHWDGPNLSELTQIVSGIDGVSHVVELTLVDETGRPCLSAHGDPKNNRVPRLIMPRRDTDVHVRLKKSGQNLSVPISDLINRYERLVFATESLRHRRAAHEPVSPFPTGEPAQFGNYTSIQHHLPPTYGVGHYGLPASAPAARKAESRQLQAYLLLFEQLMIDFQQGLASLPRLFSTDETLENSYFHRILREADLPGIENLYLHGASVADDGLGHALALVDNLGDRRSRVLDFMLAMHGEEFEQPGTGTHGFAGNTLWSTEAEYLRAKTAFLRRAPHVNGRGMEAFDYSKAPGPENVSALAEKLGMLLGLPARHAAASTTAVLARGFRHLTDVEFLLQTGLAHAATLVEDEIPIPLSIIPRQDDEESILDMNLLCPALMNRGSDLNHYRIVSGVEKAGAYSLFLDLGERHGYYRLSQHPNKRSAVEEANRLSHFINTLADETAGFHLVEHLLLRHSGHQTGSHFHAFRMSAVFPNWSPHYSSAEYRKVIERTIKYCCPAHLCVDVLWLDFETMSVFEHLHDEWLNLIRDRAANHQAIERVSGDLALLLERGAPKPGDRVQWL